ncbi:MAG: glycosyl hydrolase family 28 protein [Terracidiphilus sp.]
MGNSHPRPRLVVFDHCKHVRVEGVTIQNSPFWQLVPYYCDDVLIRNVRILAQYPSPNTDAVDFLSPHRRMSTSIISMPTPATTISP